MEGRAKALAGLCQGFGVDILYAFGSRTKEVEDWVEILRPRGSMNFVLTSLEKRSEWLRFTGSGCASTRNIST